MLLRSNTFVIWVLSRIILADVCLPVAYYCLRQWYFQCVARIGIFSTVYIFFELWTKESAGPSHPARLCRGVKTTQAEKLLWQLRDLFWYLTSPVNADQSNLCRRKKMKLKEYQQMVEKKKNSQATDLYLFVLLVRADTLLQKKKNESWARTKAIVA